MSKRVIHIVATNNFAGTERYVATLARGQAERGAEVTVVGGYSGAMQPILGSDVAHREYAGPGATLRYLRSLSHPDVVHTHLTIAELLGCAAFPSPREAKVVSTRHIASRRGSSVAGRLAGRLIRFRLDGQIAPSRYLAGRVDGSSEVILTGVADSPLGPHNERVVLVAQRLEAEKDTATALRAWAASNLSSSGWRLEVAGTGSEERLLRQLADALGITDSCTFLGHIDDIAERMANAAIVLCTATGDSFGLTAVEAMACGAAVVASAAGGHVETVGPVEGAALYPTSDHASAADQLVRLAEDLTLRSEYGQRLRFFQQKELSIVPFVDRINAFYDRVLAGRSLTAQEPSR